MDEEKQAGEEVKKEPKKDKETPEETLVRMNAAADRMEEGNRELALLLEKQEKMKVEATLGGEANAGKEEKSDEEKKTEAAKAYLEGTGLAEEAFPESKKT